MRLIETRAPVGEAAQFQLRNYSLIVIAAGVVVAILYWARAVFITATVAVIVALILQPFVAFLMRLRFPRGLAALVVCVLGLLALYLVGAAAYRQISKLPAQVPAFKERLGALVDDVSARR